MGWFLLAGAILTEVAGTLALRVAASAVAHRLAWYGAVAAGYAVSFVLMSLALDRGIPLGVLYGIWSAVGVALTAVAGHLIFGEPLNRVMATGIAFIMAGVLLVELGTP